MTRLPAIPPRDPKGHKGTFGTVAVLGGQSRPPRMMVGGPAFTAEAALRVGAGLAVLAVPAPLMTAAMQITPSATGVALPVDSRGDLDPSAVAATIDRYIDDWSVLAIGPGLGADLAQQQIVVRLISQASIPLVIDADALNALAATPQFSGDLQAEAVLTPHPGEYRRLAGSLQIDADPIAPDARPEAAARLAQRLGCIVVLKGAGTVVSDGLRTWTNETGNAALASAGTGDVLTGVIASMIAQFRGALDLFDCARLGVHVHGLAADRWAARHGMAGMLAADLLRELPDTLSELAGRGGSEDG